MKASVVAALLGGLLIASTALAQRPSENVNPGRHPNLAAAQRAIEQAFNRLTEAQRANEWDMKGHAEKAKKLLDEASEEIKLAAEASNRR